MKRRLNTVIGKGRGKMSISEFCKLTGLVRQRVYQLLAGTRGESDPWVHYKTEVTMTKTGVKTETWIDEITYKVDPIKVIKIKAKYKFMKEPSE